MSAKLKDAYFAKWLAFPLLLRPHHWIKNVFILLPVFFAGQMRSQSIIAEAVAAVLVFCIVSSVVYIVNDLRDMEADRMHEKKKSRPLASGVVSPASAFGLLITLIGGAVLALWWLELGQDFLLVLLTYVVINIGYSFGLKQVGLIEIFLVASGYVLRLIAGGFVAQEQISN